MCSFVLRDFHQNQSLLRITIAINTSWLVCSSIQRAERSIATAWGKNFRPLLLLLLLLFSRWFCVRLACMFVVCFPEKPHKYPGCVRVLCLYVCSSGQRQIHFYVLFVERPHLSIQFAFDKAHKVIIQNYHPAANPLATQNKNYIHECCLASKRSNLYGNFVSVRIDIDQKRRIHKSVTGKKQRSNGPLLSLMVFCCSFARILVTIWIVGCVCIHTYYICVGLSWLTAYQLYRSIYICSPSSIKCIILRCLPFVCVCCVCWLMMLLRAEVCLLAMNKITRFFGGVAGGRLDRSRAHAYSINPLNGSNKMCA